MALSRETAGKIIEVVAADSVCQRIIEPHPVLDYVNPLTLWMRYTHLAGSFRNATMMATGKYVGDKDFDEKICIGIQIATSAAIIRAIIQGKLPEVGTSGAIHRVFLGNHHQATWIRMKDDSQYVFDWHATLKINDPVISKEALWLIGIFGVNYSMFNRVSFL